MSIALNGQNSLVIGNGASVNMTGGSMNLENSKFVNNGEFNATEGNINITGTTSNDNSEIGGTSSTTFYNLTISLKFQTFID